MSPSEPQPKPPARTRRVELIVLAVLLGVAAVISPVWVHSKINTAHLTETIKCGRSIKLCMDTFAMDNDGEYPDDTTAAFYGVPAPGMANDYFKQLFASGNTNSERIFWIRGAAVCNPEAPDDVTTSSGLFAPARTLLPGDNGWAYVKDQLYTDNPQRPILVASPAASSGLAFDPDVFNGGAIVIRIDGSATTAPVTPSRRLLDEDGVELLTPASKVWNGTPVHIAHP